MICKMCIEHPLFTLHRLGASIFQTARKERQKAAEPKRKFLACLLHPRKVLPQLTAIRATSYPSLPDPAADLTPAVLTGLQIVRQGGRLVSKASQRSKTEKGGDGFIRGGSVVRAEQSDLSQTAVYRAVLHVQCVYVVVRFLEYARCIFGEGGRLLYVRARPITE